MKREIFYSEAIKEALEISLKKDKSVIILGLGVDDPKGVFGTTLNLHKKFKKNVFDMPTAENGLTGISLGLATKGFKPVIVHQRVEFSLLSMEQIINQIAKWHYMSAGKIKISIVIRLIIGKGWGQGPQHSQSLETLFAHIPGLKVVSPSTPSDAKGMLIGSIFDKNPIIFFEHRWLHSIKGQVDTKFFKRDIKKAKIVKSGKDISIVSFSYSLIECLKAYKFLKEKFNISVQILDLRILRPLDKKTILKALKKTKKILFVDNGMKTFGIGSEISSLINESFKKKYTVVRLGVKETPIPSTISLSKYCYPEHNLIIKEALKLLGIKYSNKIIPKLNKSPDQPDENSFGPF
jgi:pyruvate/2-oxoglutarate/acetoin dehydrogenase E1 component